MNIDNIRQVYFIGIGGIGMSALARYFQHLGCLVGGYDKTETPLTQALSVEGMTIQYADDSSLIREEFKAVSDDTLIVYTPAVPVDLGILNKFRTSGHTLYKRSQVLGLISQNCFTIAVAGTHGKTTTSTLVAHVLRDSGYGCSAFLGGISTNYQSNALFGDNNVIVVEADEYDRSFLTLYPNIAVVTSADADHLDIYGDASQLLESFELFLSQVNEEGTSIVKAGLPFRSTVTYSGYGRADSYADNVRVAGGAYHFDYVYQEGRIDNIHLGIPGNHNVENAVAAIAVARLLGIDDDKIVAALSNFKGVKRRFEYVVREHGHIYIDDYAHHPEELRAFFASVRKLYPDKKLTAIFQPHLFTRTRDFADGFATVLSEVDSLLLMPIYPARELPIAGIDAQWLLDKVSVEDKHLLDHAGVTAYVAAHRPELLVTVGAGDIDKLVKPLQAIFTT